MLVQVHEIRDDQPRLTQEDVRLVRSMNISFLKRDEERVLIDFVY